MAAQALGLSIKLVASVTLIFACWNLGTAAKIHAKAWLAQSLLERAWHRTIEGEKNVRPWSWADTWPTAELQVPKLGVRQVVLYGDSGRVLAFGPGQAEAGATIGHPGVTLISGHRDTHFRFLKDIESGDILKVITPEASFSYTVVEQGVVDQRFFSPQTNTSESYVMLVTCFPFDTLSTGGDLRYVIVAKKQHAASNQGAPWQDEK